MPWTREKLEAEWIGGPIEALGDRAPAAYSAFDCVEKHFGAEGAPSSGLVFFPSETQSDQFDAPSRISPVRILRREEEGA
jgi:hypothetical protein